MPNNPRIDKLAQLLFNQPNLQACTLREVKDYANNYPWNAAAQLLLTKKLMQTEPENFSAQVNKAHLFFPNTVWLNYLVTDDFTAEVTKKSKKEDLLFEPFHTVDYFASQGIKFVEETNPTDKFGQQVKSFTDWIKVMKRLPISEIGKNIDPREEKKVEKMAGASLTDREVVTESMAEVWEKQGNRQKAIEVYRKLSLLEPTKNAYFASKIDQLNKTK
jgi:hypothetical protein